MQIGRKIYYDLATGNVVLDTGEREGHVVATTIQQDLDSYTVLAERDPITFGVVQLAFGAYAADFEACDGYRIDPDTEQIEFSYPDPDNPTTPVYQLPLSAEVAALKEENLLLMEAVADIYEMVLIGGSS